MSQIAVVFTGGTISMRASVDAGGATPALAAADIVDLVPGLDEIATLELVDWGLVPGSHLTFGQAIDIGRTVGALLERPKIDGAVVVQGTDNIEETAYAWDLLPLPDKPFIVVGAMRSASQDGYDGPENLRNAVAAACRPELGDQGVVVSMAGTLHGADVVRKSHTHAYDTFRSLNSGPLGVVADGRVVVSHRRRHVHLPAIPTQFPHVSLVTAVLGETDYAIAQEDAGIVIAAMGGGNTQVELLEAGRRAMSRGQIVVVATRCPTGGVRPGYAFPGGSTTWWDAGAVFGGSLDAFKCRVALTLGLGVALDRTGLARLFEPYGGGARV